MGEEEELLRRLLADAIDGLRFASWDRATTDWERGYDAGLAKARAVVLGEVNS